MNTFLVGLIFGFLAFITLPLWFAAGSATIWATKDSWILFRSGELKPEESKLDWAWIVPKYFFRQWIRTFREHLAGLVRV